MGGILKNFISNQILKRFVIGKIDRGKVNRAKINLSKINRSKINRTKTNPGKINGDKNNKGSVLMEFGLSIIVLIIFFLSLAVAGIFFVAYANGYYVAKSFYTIIRESDYPYNTVNNHQRIKFQEGNQTCNTGQNQESVICLNCSSLSEENSDILMLTLCMARSVAANWYWLIKPSMIEIVSTRLASQGNQTPQDSGVILNIITHFDVLSSFAQIFGIDEIIMSISGYAL